MEEAGFGGGVSGAPFCTCDHLEMNPNGDELPSWLSKVHFWNF